MRDGIVDAARLLAIRYAFPGEPMERDKKRAMNPRHWKGFEVTILVRLTMWWRKMMLQLDAVAVAAEYDFHEEHRRDIASISERLDAVENALAGREPSKLGLD